MGIAEADMTVAETAMALGAPCDRIDPTPAGGGALDGAVFDVDAASKIEPADARSCPVVSIVMANHNGARFIEAAVRSALRQSLAEIEIIVADDASTDDSAARVARMALADPRIKLLRRIENGGAAAARNTALDRAVGRYVAVMDSDDLMHPDRLRRLVALAEAHDADIVADDLLIFHQDGVRKPSSLLGGSADRWIDATAYVRGNAMESGPTLGYLKPLFRRDAIEHRQMRYDPTLLIAEDYAFVLSLLALGARFWVSNELTYFYRKHDNSLSHRLSADALVRMQQADLRFQPPCEMPKAFDAARAQRRRGMATALAVEQLVGAIKQRRLGDALGLAVAHPRAAWRLRRSISERVRRVLGGRVLAGRTGVSGGSSGRSERKSVCLISRQRVVGRTNGSSVYLLSLCAALDARGLDVHLVCPSPSMFGSWPALWMRPEMALIKSIRVRGAWHFGRLIVSRDPLVIARAARAVAARILFRLGATLPSDKAPYAIGVPWEREDYLFVAEHARPHSDAILADYAFLTAGIPYALRPEAPSAVVMHDLFSGHGRPGGPRPPNLVRIDAEHEMALLGGADAVLAIQAEEAAEITRLLPHRRVILAPMAVPSVESPQPGNDATVLFVGSNTGPNVDGLGWFLGEVWPRIRAARPATELVVAGGVADGIASRPAGVRFLGQVPNLTGLYKDAGVVVSPLRHGSGLKIKLVEALANGKAAVVTGVTMQGVEALTERAVIRADSAEAFANGVVGLLENEPGRRALSTAALEVARGHFSIEACYGAMTLFFTDALSAIEAVL